MSNAAVVQPLIHREIRCEIGVEICSNSETWRTEIFCRAISSPTPITNVSLGTIQARVHEFIPKRTGCIINPMRRNNSVLPGFDEKDHEIHFVDEYQDKSNTKKSIELNIFST